MLDSLPTDGLAVFHPSIDVRGDAYVDVVRPAQTADQIHVPRPGMPSFAEAAASRRAGPPSEKASM